MPAPADAGNGRAPVFRARLRGAVARALSPLGYLGLFGGMQLGLVLLLSRFWPAWLTVAGAIAFGALVAGVAKATGRWTAKMLGLVLVISLLVVGPAVVLMHDRTVRGITSMEHDGAIQAEVAMHRLLHGQSIYGVDWSRTAVGRVPWNYSLAPSNPALHHNVYFPLVPLSGVPVAWVMQGLGIPYDYRQVLLLFLAIGLGAVWILPIAPARRFAIAVTLFLTPLLALYFWAGRNDVPVVALVMLGLALLARNRPAAAGLVMGGALAYKLFAAPAVPFLLATLWLRWRAGKDAGELARALLALAAVPLLTIVPFFLTTPAAFVRDVVLYPGAGGPQSYPISGLGLGGFLLAIHALHRTDRFPFWAFQLVALAVALRLALPWYVRRPSLGRWLAGFTAALFAMTFFSRYFNDSHAALVLALFAGCVPMGDSVLLMAQRHPHPTLAERGGEDMARGKKGRRSWLELGTWR